MKLNPTESKLQSYLDGQNRWQSSICSVRSHAVTICCARTQWRFQGTEEKQNSSEGDDPLWR